MPKKKLNINRKKKAQAKTRRKKAASVKKTEQQALPGQTLPPIQPAPGSNTANADSPGMSTTPK